MTSHPPSYMVSQIPRHSRYPPFSSISISLLPISMHPVRCALANSVCTYLYPRCPAVAQRCLEGVSCSLVRKKYPQSEGFGIRQNP
ncbi:hypothetical protein CEXT_578861 [Caerostris extrusa]|uniref:Uncharacterized protein n=1 Tax=Caerostris extrusa TaxID=172846 RepID=A0AAV4N885_CAEEX|nr:hypothetical protein CEXT_578861 [Caerostris extrusa]